MQYLVSSHTTFVAAYAKFIEWKATHSLSLPDSISSKRSKVFVGFCCPNRSRTGFVKYLHGLQVKTSIARQENANIIDTCCFIFTSCLCKAALLFGGFVGAVSRLDMTFVPEIDTPRMPAFLILKEHIWWGTSDEENYWQIPCQRAPWHRRTLFLHNYKTVCQWGMTMINHSILSSSLWPSMYHHNHRHHHHEPSDSFRLCFSIHTPRVPDCEIIVPDMSTPM